MLLFRSNLIRGILSSHRYQSSWTVKLTFDNGLVDNQNRSWIPLRPGISGTISTNSKFGSGAMYNNSDQSGCVYYTDPSFAAGVNDFTYDFWYNSASSSQSENEILDFRGSAGNNGFAIFITGNSLALWNNAGYITSNIPNFFVVGTYVRVTITRKAGTLRIFRNGVKVYEMGYILNFDSTRFNLGGRYDYYAPGSSYLSAIGYMDDFKFNNNIAYWDADFDPNIEIL